MRHALSALLLLVVTASAALAADATYFGKWKLNPAKSQFPRQTMIFEKTPSGDYRWDADDMGASFYFRIDGKECPWIGGGTVSCKSPSTDVVECAGRQKGEIMAIYKMTITGRYAHRS